MQFTANLAKLRKRVHDELYTKNHFLDTIDKFSALRIGLMGWLQCKQIAYIIAHMLQIRPLSR